MDNNKLLKILAQEMAKYGGEGLNCVSYITENLEQMVFTSTTMYSDTKNPQPLVDLFVRILGDKIIVEEDRNSDPLYEALVEAGIPREKIILAYAGEPVPDTA
jgi:XisI protein